MFEFYFYQWVKGFSNLDINLFYFKTIYLTFWCGVVQKGHTYFLNSDTDPRSRLFKYVWPFVTTTYESIEQHYLFEKKKHVRISLIMFVLLTFCRVWIGKCFFACYDLHMKYMYLSIQWYRIKELATWGEKEKKK